MNWPTSSAFRFASASLFSAALLFAAAGCEDPNDLGVELPGTAPINTEYRDYPVTASTILQTPVETVNATHFLVGRVQDTKLGTTVAQAFLNLQAPYVTSTDSVPSKFTDPVLDSVVVVAGFDQVYGSSAAPVSFDVYKLTSALDDRSTYNSATVIPLTPDNKIGSDRKSSLTRTKVVQQANGLKTRKRNATTGFYEDTSTDSLTNVTLDDRTVRLTIYRKAVGTLPAIPSPSNFAQNVFNAIKDKNTPFTQAVLNDLWKGLAIVPADNFSASVVGFNRALENHVLFYYHVSNPNSNEVPYPLSFSNSSGSANAPRAYTRLNTALTSPFDQLTDGTKSVAPSAPDQVTYIQEGLGLGTKLEIPGLAELVANKEGLAINRAELIVPLKPYSSAVFPAPPQAVIYELDASNKILQRTINISPYERLVQADGYDQKGASATQLTANSNATAALYNSGATNKYYSVSVTSYLQAYVYDQLGGERPAAFMFYPIVRYSPYLSSSLDLTLNRATLDAQNIKLRVYFSKLR